jgi:hypothetical protein
VIARDPAGPAAEARAKVETVRRSSDDASILLHAREGTESLFPVMPLSFNTNYVRDYYLRFTRPVYREIAGGA